MNAELIQAIRDLCKERGIDADMLYAAIEEALVSAYKREFNAKNAENIRAEVDRESGNMNVFLMREVVEEVLDPNSEISLEEAQAIDEEFELGDLLEYELSPQDFGRLAAQTAKSVINQKLIEAESQRISSEFNTRIGELASGVVQRKDRREVVVDIGRAEAVLQLREQVRQDVYNFGQRMRFYILRVDTKHGRPVVHVSRSHPNLVRKLFEAEVPEIQEGIVNIFSVAREAGYRTKIAVYTTDADVDPVGSCIGARRMRIQNVMDELHGEKIDVVLWDENPEIFIRNALAPARVLSVQMYRDGNDNIAEVVVPDNQLPLAIGRSGQNARLAAKLTNWKIDIKSVSQVGDDYEYNDEFHDAISELTDLALAKAESSLEKGDEAYTDANDEGAEMLAPESSENDADKDLIDRRLEEIARSLDKDEE